MVAARDQSTSSLSPASQVIAVASRSGATLGSITARPGARARRPTPLPILIVRPSAADKRQTRYHRLHDVADGDKVPRLPIHKLLATERPGAQERKMANPRCMD
jgi:hypothetical protein